MKLALHADTANISFVLYIHRDSKANASWFFLHMISLGLCVHYPLIKLYIYHSHLHTCYM